MNVSAELMLELAKAAGASDTLMAEGVMRSAINKLTSKKQPPGQAGHTSVVGANAGGGSVLVVPYTAQEVAVSPPVSRKDPLYSVLCALHELVVHPETTLVVRERLHAIHAMVDSIRERTS